MSLLDPKVEEYLKNAKYYYENSQNILGTGELLWGAIAESIKALKLKILQRTYQKSQSNQVLFERIVIEFL